MSATPKVDLFERFKRLYGLAGDSAPETAADNRQSAPAAKLDHPADPGADALALLDRWKGYLFPGAHLAEVRELAAKLLDLQDAAALLKGLREFESDLRALGGEYEPELADAVAMVERTFPGARLIEVRRRPLN